MTDTTLPAEKERTWFGHPRPLALLFTTEAWERFGYYGMRAILVLYLVEHFGFADTVGNGLYGAFTSLVYLTPLVGGYIADRYFGQKNAVKLGAVLMSVGYLMLAFTGGEEAKPYVTINNQKYDVQVVKDEAGNSAKYVVADGQHYKITGNQDSSITLEGVNAGSTVPATVAKDGYRFDSERDPLAVILLFVSLAVIIVGNGYFKPNISTIVGTLYSKEDRRRDAGFTIFYMGINLGSIFSQTLCPLIAKWYGYKWGFALAGFGMLLAALRFQLSGRRIAGYGNRPEGAKNRDLIIFIGSLVAIPIAWFLLTNAMETAQMARAAADGGAQSVWSFLMAQPLLGKVMFAVFFAAMIGVPLWSIITLKAVEWKRMWVAVILTFFSVVFWTLFEQAGSSMTLFADRNTDLHIGYIPILASLSPEFADYTMPAGQVQIFNPLFIVFFAPLFSVMWNWLGKRGLEPATPYKFVIALVLVGLGFLALVWGGKTMHGADFRVPLLLLAFAYFLHSMGELCLSPVGLSMISKLSVPKLVGMMMGMWFLSSAMAQYVGGIIAQFASTETVAGAVLNNEVALNTSFNVFWIIGIGALISAGILLLLAPFLRRAMGGIR